MADRTNATAAGPTTRPESTSTEAGILRPEQLARHTSLERTAAHPDLERWVENHWTLGWRLPPGRSFDSHTVPHPACTLSVELGHARAGVGDDRVVVTGVATRRFDVRLAGHGWVHGVKFRPGGLAALTGLHAADLTDRTRPAGDLLPAPVVAALRLLDTGPDGPDTGPDTGLAPYDAARLAEDALRLLDDPGPDPAYDEVLALVALMLEDRELVAVAQVEARHGIGRRRLQRLFARYVGASPKWVLARYRLHDVVSALDEGYDGPLADLAVRFGWYDQAHFTRDFRAVVGVPPGEYRDRR